MRRMASGIVVAALIGAALAGFATPAAAEACKNGKLTQRHCGGASSHDAGSRTTHEFAAQTTRPRVTIYPRRQQLTANSVRQCRAQMVKEYRPSGTVVVPRMHCWWE
jgi:hypothetical protein